MSSSDEKLINKTRKDYDCTYCGELIPQGSKCFNIKITPMCHPNNDKYMTFRIHEKCKIPGDRFYFGKYEITVQPHAIYYTDFKDYLKDYQEKNK